MDGVVREENARVQYLGVYRTVGANDVRCEVKKVLLTDETALVADSEQKRADWSTWSNPLAGV